MSGSLSGDIQASKAPMPKWFIALAVVFVLVVAGIGVAMALLAQNKPTEITIVQEDVSSLKLAAANEEEARAATEEAIDQVLVEDVSAAIELDEVKTVEVDEETTVYRFDMRYEGVEVYGKTAVLETVDGQASQLTVDAKTVSDVDMAEKIDSSAALAAAQKAASSGQITTSGMMVDSVDKGSSKTSSSTTSIIPQGKAIYSLHGVEPTLCYKFLVVDNSICSYVFVSASDGSLIADESLIRTIQTTGHSTSMYGYDLEFTTELEGDTYYLYDASKGIATFDLNGEELEGFPYWITPDEMVYFYSDVLNCYVDFNDTSNRIPADEVPESWGGPEGFYVLNDETTIATNESSEWENSAAVETHALVSGAHSLYQYLGRDGFSGLGSDAQTMVFANDGSMEGKNAYSVYGYYQLFTIISVGKYFDPSPDVIGHEYTHSTENSISHLSYMGESGAIMEATSDIMGEICEDYMDDGLLNGTNDWSMSGLRDLANPENPMLNSGTRNPVEYGGANWGDPKDTTMDRGYVHGNSTVLSHAFYLMCTDNELAGTALTTQDMGCLVLDTFAVITREDCTMQEYAALMLNQAESKLDESKVSRMKVAFDKAKISYTLSTPTTDVFLKSGSAENTANQEKATNTNNTSAMDNENAGK